MKRTCVRCQLATTSPIIGGRGAECIEVTGYCPPCLEGEVSDAVAEATAATDDARALADRGEQWLSDVALAAVNALAGAK